ncbi:TRAF interacting protein no poles [Megachile rotundata]|uniref:TRAF interacting protein no poles n=1 Tax=Megachile rotundata TaxID=143995 RepID=UPI003FD28C00
MNIVCVICSDLLIPSDDVFHTPCGHIFHFVCLTQWLERSRSCPQCREKTTSHKIHRIYFNFSNNDTIVDDTCSLQDKLDKMNFQLILKQNELKQFMEKSETFEKQTAELKKEVYKLESELRAKKCTIDALKDQIKYFKQQNLEVEAKRQEIEQLRKEIETYKNVQTLLEASTEHVDEIISRTAEPTALITYICVMKREMTVSLNKRKELRSKLRSVQQELTKVTTERNLLSEEQVKRKKLEEDLMICESEKMFLQNKVKELERNISLAKRTSDYDSQKVDALNSDLNLLSNSEQNKVKTAVNDAKTERKSNTERRRSEDKSQSTEMTDDTNSPYLPLKSGGLFVLKHSVTKRNTSNLNPSIFTKRPRTEKPNEQVRGNLMYDGFGGHSKLERFPNPLSMKMKKAKEDAKFKLDARQRSLI